MCNTKIRNKLEFMLQRGEFVMQMMRLCTIYTVAHLSSKLFQGWISINTKINDDKDELNVFL